MANNFQIGDRVKTAAGAATARTNGIIKHIACYAATTKGGKMCKKSTCYHAPKEYIWVEWANNGASFSYHESELVIDNFVPANAPQPAVAPSPGSYGYSSPTTQPSKQDDSAESSNPASPAIDTNNLAKEVASFKKAIQNHKTGAGASVPLSRPLEVDEIDFDAYNGFKGTRNVSYRKL